MRTPEDIRKKLAAKFRSKRTAWLVESTEAPESRVPSDFPLEYVLDVPSEQTAASDWNALSKWVSEWKDAERAGHFKLERVKRVWPRFGEQLLPARVVIESPESAVAWLGSAAEKDWARALSRRDIFRKAHPECAEEICRHWDVLAEWSDKDFDRLLRALQWLFLNRQSGLYIRQLPIEGLDTKWLTAARRRLAASLLILKLEHAGESVDPDLSFEALCGLRELPMSLVRVRLLDEAFRSALGGMGDISAPAEELSKLSIRPAHVFISENLQTGLAFEDMPGSVVVCGQGNNLDSLRHIPWIADADCVYWGDLDTFGFRILSNARKVLPHLRSVMMDLATLERFREMAVLEPVQTVETELAGLTEEEERAFRALRDNRFGHHLRLEQERIAWPYAREGLKKAIGLR